MGINPKTIRYDEQIGLIPLAPRTSGVIDEQIRPLDRRITELRGLRLELLEASMPPTNTTRSGLVEPRSSAAGRRLTSWWRARRTGRSSLQRGYLVGGAREADGSKEDLLMRAQLLDPVLRQHLLVSSRLCWPRRSGHCAGTRDAASAAQQA